MNLTNVRHLKDRRITLQGTFHNEVTVRTTMIDLMRSGISRELIDVVVPEDVQKKLEYRAPWVMRIWSILVWTIRGALYGLLVFLSLAVFTILFARDRELPMVFTDVIFDPNLGLMLGATLGLVIGFVGALLDPRTPIIKQLEKEEIVMVVKVKSPHDLKVARRILTQAEALEKSA